MAEKAKFDPSKPFTVVEERGTKFDPSKPFTVVKDGGAKFDPSKPFEVVTDSAPPGKDGPGLVDVGKALMKGYDYMGGLGRVSSNAAYDAWKMTHLPNQKFHVTGKDVIDALQGNAPTPDEYLDRRGYEPGLGRLAAGTAIGMATDPSTYLGGGLISKAVTKMGGKAPALLRQIQGALDIGAPTLAVALTKSKDPEELVKNIVGSVLAAQVLKSPKAAGLLSKGLVGVGKSGLIDSGARSVYSNFNREKRPPE